ncbi:hypothetical protein [Aminipila sp.]|nr:hypothetical protein [Aminipila sp.]
MRTDNFVNNKMMNNETICCCCYMQMHMTMGVLSAQKTAGD